MCRTRFHIGWLFLFAILIIFGSLPPPFEDKLWDHVRKKNEKRLFQSLRQFRITFPNLSSLRTRIRMRAFFSAKIVTTSFISFQTRPSEGGGPPMSNPAPSRGGHHSKSRGGGGLAPSSSAPHRLPPAASSVPPSGAHPSRPRHTHPSSSAPHSGPSSSSAANGSHENNGRRNLNG